MAHSINLLLVLLCITSTWAATIVGSKSNGRIFNGGTATETQFPYQAHIAVTKEDRMEEDRICAGAILSPDWIVTSAYCIIGARLALIQVGSTTVITSDPHRIVVFGDRFYIPDGFDNDPDTAFTNNVGLIKLKTSLAFNAYVRRINITDMDLPDETIVTVSGWGGIIIDSNVSTNYLQFALMKIVSNKQCFPNGTGTVLTDDTICAESTTGRIKNICPGDEGVPLVLNAGTSNPILVGIGILWQSNEACGENHASKFTRVYNFTNWIKLVTGI